MRSDLSDKNGWYRVSTLRVEFLACGFLFIYERLMEELCQLLKNKLKALREETLASLKQISAENEKELQDLRVSVLGKKGSLTEILKGMKDVSAEMRPIIGKHVNEARDVLTAAFEETAKLLEEKKVAAQLASESIDVTLPGRPVATGHRHVLTQTSEEIEDIFIGDGLPSRGWF